MATSIRIKVGLETYQFALDSAIELGAGEPLRPAEALRLIQRLGDRELRSLRPLASSAARRLLDYDEGMHPALAQLLTSGRLRVRKIEAESIRALSSKRTLEPEHEAVQNEIAETHQVTIELLDAEGNPVPGEPYRIELPDGRVVTGKLDEQGRAQVTGIPQAGTCQVCFYQRDAAIWA